VDRVLVVILINIKERETVRSFSDREKGYLLITVTPEKLEVVSVKKGITGDSSNWSPPTVTFKGPTSLPR